MQALHSLPLLPCPPPSLAELVDLLLGRTHVVARNVPRVLVRVLDVALEPLVLDLLLAAARVPVVQARGGRDAAGDQQGRVSVSVV